MCDTLPPDDACPPSPPYVDDLLSRLSDPDHRRILKAYDPADPVAPMEQELSAILLEVFTGED